MRLTKNISKKQSYCEFEIKNSRHQDIYDFVKYSELEDYVDCDLTLAVDKLGQLEDVEEELGIDLITYVKLTTQPIIYFKNYPYDSEIKKAMVNSISVNDIEPKEYLVWLTDLENNRYLYPLKRYGLNFAITKGELEND